MLLFFLAGRMFGRRQTPRGGVRIVVLEARVRPSEEDPLKPGVIAEPGEGLYEARLRAGMTCPRSGHFCLAAALHRLSQS